MPRIRAQPEDITEPVELVSAIRKRRGGKLNSVDRLLLHAPSIAAGWNQLFLALRSTVELSEKHRELAICRVALLHRDDFEIDVHAPIFLKAGGTSEQLAALGHLGETANHTVLFDATERAVIRLATESTRDGKVSDDTFNELRSNFSSERHIVELVVVVAAYNMSARVIAALAIR
jgi:alkylhydroperoxidase family enzyme